MFQEDVRLNITMALQTLRVCLILAQRAHLGTYGFNTTCYDGHGLETKTNLSKVRAYFPACFPQGSASPPPRSALREGLVATGILRLGKQKQPRAMRAYFPYCPPASPQVPWPNANMHIGVAKNGFPDSGNYIIKPPQRGSRQ